MRTKKVCQTDLNGYFIGMTEADESPLEPGVFLIPAGGIEADPPKEFPNQRVKWAGGKWVYEDIPQPPEPEPVDPKHEKNYQSKLYLAQTDWYVVRFAETGTPIPDDVLEARKAARAAIVE